MKNMTTVARYNGVDVLLDGQKVGEVVKVFRYGYQYWKVVGFKTLYSTQREAVRCCALAAQGA